MRKRYKQTFFQSQKSIKSWRNYEYHSYACFIFGISVRSTRVNFHSRFHIFLLAVRSLAYADGMSIGCYFWSSQLCDDVCWRLYLSLIFSLSTRILYVDDCVCSWPGPVYMILMHMTNRNVYLQAVPLFSGGPLMRLNDKYVSAGCFKCQNINKHLNPSSSTQVVVLSIKDARDLEIL